jgi:hypothetical protein
VVYRPAANAGIDPLDTLAEAGPTTSHATVREFSTDDQQRAMSAQTRMLRLRSQHSVSQGIT